MALYVFSPPVPSAHGHRTTLCRAVLQLEGLGSAPANSSPIRLVPILEIEVPVNGPDALRPDFAPRRWSAQTTAIFLGATDSQVQTYEVVHQAAQIQATPERRNLHIFIRPATEIVPEEHATPLRLAIMPSGEVNVVTQPGFSLVYYRVKYYTSLLSRCHTSLSPSVLFSRRFSSWRSALVTTRDPTEAFLRLKRQGFEETHEQDFSGSKVSAYRIWVERGSKQYSEENAE
ncbi:hypothetical protein B0H13DRAFT_1878002 [Mycena leptocephala]|nr:hypothetical protein B0H13DRAFT_1878002 [Mycena leptocephala]